MIATLAVLPEFGMGVIVLRDVPQKPAESGRYLSATLVLQPLLALLGVSLLIGVGLLLPYDPSVKFLLAVASISLILDALGNIYYSQLIAAEKMIATSVIAVLHIVCIIAFVGGVLLTGGGLLGLYVGTLAAGVMRWLLHWLAARQAGLRAVWPYSAVIGKLLLTSGFPIMVSGLVRQSYQHLDKVIVLSTIGEREVGYLTAAFVIVFGVTELLNTTVLVAFFPMMSRMASTPRELRRFVDRLALLTLGAGLPLAIGISLFAGRLSSLLFPGFVGTASVLEILIWHTLPIMISNLYAQLLVIEHRQTLNLIIRVASLGLNLLLNLALLPTLGVRGAAIAILIAECVGLAGVIVARLRPIPQSPPAITVTPDPVP
jgi:O-antigen/teichoic acid export membrane protein